MENNNVKKGLSFGMVAAFMIGLQPIVANSRPTIIDAYIFAAMTTLIEAIVFFPFMLIERKKIKSDCKN